MELGRWPNYGFDMSVEAPTSAQFTYNGTRPERWTEADDIWVHGYWSYYYAELHNHVVAIDTATKTITIEGDRHYGVRETQPWYAYNLLEEIDSPGEWYLDRGTSILYFLPPGNLAAGETYVSTLNGDLLQLDDAGHVSFEGVRLEFSRDNLVTIAGGDHNVLVDCVLLGAGTDAAVISGADSGLEGCEIAWPGRGGVTLAGGDRHTLTPSGNRIQDCDIHHFSRFDYTYTPAVRLDGCGHVVVHNAIHDAPHSAIMYGGNEHRIEYNEIYNVCRFAGDAGAVYTGRDWASQGTVLRHNFIHHVTSGFGGDVHGIYLDDCDSGETVFGNVLYRVGGIALENGGGRDNFFENNIVAWAGRGHNADRRGTAWINDTPGSGMNMLEKIRQFNYQSPPWSTAYPRLAAIPNNYALLDPYKNPGGSTCSRNIFWQASPCLAENAYWGSEAFHYYDAIEDNLVDADPRFVDEASLDLNVRPDSPALSIPGFQPIPFDEIGIQPRDARLSPADGALTGLNPALAWSEVPGALSYDVYLGRDEDEVRAADRSSAAFQGNVTDRRLTPPGDLFESGTFFWRVDALTDTGRIAGQFHRFTAGAWQQDSIGAVGLLGSTVFSNGVFTVVGGGSGIEGSSDAFHYMNRELHGDGVIVARVVGVGSTDAWAKAGVMIRETLAPNSKHATVAVTSANGVSFQHRTATGSSSSLDTTPGPQAPYWVKLERRGDLFTGYASPDSQTWTQIGSVTIPMDASVRVGLAVTAHDDQALSTARFESVMLGAEVVGRHVFYNHSAFDGDDPAANAADDGAIAPDKRALVPGEAATFANYTSYSRGINGVMVDIDFLAGTPTAADLEFRLGNDDRPDGWTTAPDPNSITVRPQEGAGGSDRVTITWPDGAIANQWLRVTVLATPRTGLIADDVFYFGHAAGESGDSSGDARVNAIDALMARNNPRTLTDPAPINFPYDYNRDARVNASDLLVARSNQTHLLDALRLWRQKSTVVITEAGTATEDYVEIQNVGAAEVDTSGWVVAVNDASRVGDWADINAYHAILWHLPDSMPACEVLYRTELDDGTGHYWGETIVWRTMGPGWVMILDDRGNVADFVVWGYQPAEIASMNVIINGFHVRGQTAWQGPAASVNTSSTLSHQRRGSSDGDAAGDWTLAAPSQGEQNAGLQPPFPTGGTPGKGPT